MLSKKNRADKNVIEKIFKGSRVINSTFLTFKYVLNSKKIAPRISFIVPKSVSKLAVKRNLLRRIGYSVLEKYLDSFPAGLEGVLVFKQKQEDLITLENEIKNILSKIN